MSTILEKIRKQVRNNKINVSMRLSPMVLEETLLNCHKLKASFSDYVRSAIEMKNSEVKARKKS